MSAARLREAAKSEREEWGDATSRRQWPTASAIHLALADWLDTAGADEWAHGPHCPTPCHDCDDDPRAVHVRAAFRVADLILGGNA